ncbi:precorrin-6A reductase [Oxobacter pfennigii]|uniref:Precorrin-6A reductase n=1 Tax=Oxobacter pfennigii TaxID=36849 RepID=A0A0P8WCF4_9CLOT|nr:precorrin-6A reductase [Oxobacter pfennigii]KPU45412.1 precorrin-6A reductase [Oxobacter pfennigii]
MIWIIGGTSEAVELVKRLRDKVKYIVTCATEGEREFLQDENLIVSRLNEEGMEGLIKKYSVDMIIDMSHPYAVEVTSNARLASQRCGIKYVRFVRGKSDINDECIFLSSYEECIEYLKDVKGCVFFTTGSKNIKDFEKVKGDNRFVYRVLPSLLSIEECVKYGVLMKDIVAVLGPFSEEMNIAMFKEYNADYVVTKDSGKIGGTEEKVTACKKLGIKLIIIGRQDEDGIYSMDEIERIILP